MGWLYISELDLVLGGLFLFINILGFIITGIDKKKAVENKWRISERGLITLAILGGAPGVYLAMRTFDHKISKPLFKAGVLFLLFIYVALLLWYISYENFI